MVGRARRSGSPSSPGSPGGSSSTGRVGCAGRSGRRLPEAPASGALVGVLALQGDYAEHARVLAGLGARPRLVRRLSELQGLAGLVLPGGESTTMLKLLQAEGFTAPAAAEAGSGPASPPGLSGPLRQFAVEGGALFATCAGAILLARRVTAPAQPSVGLLDAVIQRNGYGRQLESHIAWAACPALGAEELEMIFIRAPVIRDVGPAVQVLARHRGDPVLVRQGRILAATFHPELSVDARVHRYFLEQIVGGASARC